jgi:glycosyltransferase involved in cell wall biosynthesis
MENPALAKGGSGPADRRPKVLFLITKSNWGGAQRYVRDLAVDAQAAGWDVAVACGGSGALGDELAAAGIRAIPLPSLGRDVDARADWRACRDLWRAVGAERPDVLHVNSSKAGGLGALVGRLRRVPLVVFTAHGWAFNDPRFSAGWKRPLVRFLHLLTVAIAHRTIAVSEAVARQLGGPRWIRRRLEIILNGVEPAALLPRDAARAALAARSAAAAATFAWAETNGALVVGLMSELHPVKGLDVLAEALAQLARRQPPVPVAAVVMGEGEARGQLEALAASLNLGPRLALAGFVKEAPSHLAAFDCFALPSRSEALALAALEAGAAGLPVIASRVGGIPEAIANLETGLLVSPERPRELAEALRRLAEDPSLRARLGDALRARVAARFSRGQMSTATLDLYRRELARRG